MSNYKFPWSWPLKISVGIFAFFLTLTAMGLILNQVFAVRELSPAIGINVSDVLATIDANAGIPTAVTPPTTSVATSTPDVLDDYNLILIGNDYRPGRLPACEDCFAVYSDAFVYVNLSFGEAPRAIMVSLPRELYLHVDGIEPDSRINQLYARGGVDWIRMWSESILGVKIDGVAIVNMHMFEQLVDELGGIDVLARETFTDKCGSDFFSYEENTLYHLDGYDALCYARMRLYNPRGYFARQERHMEILIDIFDAVDNEFTEDPIVTSVKFVSLYYDYVETDMSPELIAKIIADIMLNIYAVDGGIDTHSISINANNLELYPRADDNSPYLYKPTFVISDWVQCVIGSSWPYDCGLD